MTAVARPRSRINPAYPDELHGIADRTHA